MTRLDLTRRTMKWAGALSILLVTTHFGGRPERVLANETSAIADAAAVASAVQDSEPARGLGDPGELLEIYFARSDRVESDGAAALVLRGAEARAQLVVMGRYSSGQHRDLTRTLEFTAVPPGRLEIRREGTHAGWLVPLNDGDVEVIARLEGSGDQEKSRAFEASLDVLVKGFADAPRINFPNQIVPIFTKLGCNGGGCHGKSGGQNGFRLSLLGFYPNEDHEFLVKESRGRRTFAASPDRSLLLLKATNQLPHGGGQRMEASSQEYRLIRRWMVQGMPYGKPDDPVVVGLEVLPGANRLGFDALQQLRVLAHYDNGFVEDVSVTAQYESNSKAMAVVSETGLVQTLDLAGEAAVMVRYQDQVAVFRATIPLGVEVTSTPEPANFIDELVFRKLKSLGIPPSEVCDDATFLRRVCIDIAGRTPTSSEATAFLADASADKRDRLIDRLLSSSDHADYFANKWNAILRNKQKDRTYKPGAYAFHDWIRDSLHQNKPYDVFAREILAAAGPISEVPPVAWFRSVTTVEERVEDAAQLFLGQRLQCARCHHHPFERWSQSDYYSFSAFFSRVGKKPGTLGVKRDPRIFHKRGLATAVNPRSGESLKPAGLGSTPLDIPAGRDPRLALVDWMRDPANPYFAKSLVNRYWKHFFGRGIVDPEDDLRVTNPPSHPVLFDALARSFIDGGFDLKELVRSICRSKTYQLSSIPNAYNHREQQSFSRYYPKRLTAEVLYDSVQQLLGTQPKFEGMPESLRAVALPDASARNYFLTVFGKPSGDSSCECERSQDANLAQSLHLMNSKQIQEKISAPEGRAASLAKEQSRSIEEKVRELLLWAFAREPEVGELEVTTSYVAERNGEPAAFEDLAWALINTKEFLFNH